MKIVITVDEAIDLGIWEKFRKMKGISEWALNEGLMSIDDEITLSKEEAVDLGVYPIKSSMNL